MTDVSCTVRINVIEKFDHGHVSDVYDLVSRDFGATHAGRLDKVYKNQGWYAAGSVYETWITQLDPTALPPSGHTLTNICHELLI